MQFQISMDDGHVLEAVLYEADAPKANVVIVHGLGEHSGRYTKMAEALVQSGINVLCYDQRGHGRTQGKRGVARLERLSKDAAHMVSYIRQRNGLPTVLFGHSMGGGVGLNTLLRCKMEICCAVITSPWVILANPPPGALLRLVGALSGVTKNLNINNGISANLLCHDEKIVDSYGPDPLNHSMVGALLAHDLCENADWLFAHAGELPVPLLLMHGVEDGICSIEGSRRFAKAAGERCSLVEFEGMFHELHNEPDVKQALFEREAEFILSHLP